MPGRPVARHFEGDIEYLWNNTTATIVAYTGVCFDAVSANIIARPFPSPETGGAVTRPTLGITTHTDLLNANFLGIAMETINPGTQGAVCTGGYTDAVACSSTESIFAATGLKTDASGYMIPVTASNITCCAVALEDIESTVGALGLTVKAYIRRGDGSGIGAAASANTL